MLVVAAALVAAGWWAGADRSSPVYASLRQSRAQEVPGTLGVVLRPPPASFAPVVSPKEAYRSVVTTPPPGGVVESLAVVASPYAEHDVTAWVVIGRGICDASSKGDVVSPGRSDPTAEGLPCTNQNLLMAVVDARTGKDVAVYRGYDASGIWSPARGT